MQFTPDSIALILAGKKCQTRRPRRDGDIFGVDSVQIASGRTKWMVGRTYAICPGRGKKSVGRIGLTGIRCERVDAITEMDAIAEGIQPTPLRGIRRYGDKQFLCATAREAYLALWRSMYPKSDCTELVWVLTFEVAP